MLYIKRSTHVNIAEKSLVIFKTWPSTLVRNIQMVFMKVHINYMKVVPSPDMNATEEALEIVMKVMAKENVPINRFHQQGQLREILKLQCEAGQEKPSFELNPEKVEKLSDLLMKYNRISHPVTVDKLKGGKE